MPDDSKDALDLLFLLESSAPPIPRYWAESLLSLFLLLARPSEIKESLFVVTCDNYKFYCFLASMRAAIDED